jgi:LysR family transcriptional regulator for metE and metH
MSLDRNHLELLAALTEHTTLASASAHINLSASAASRRLQDAERRLGMRLVELDGRTLRLTPAGHVLAEAATRVIDQLSEAELAARWLGAGEQIPVRIGLGFHDQLAWALPSHETLPFEIVRSPTSRAVDALTRRRADVAIDVAAIGHHDGHALLDDVLVLVVGTGHRLAGGSPVGAEALVDERYLASDPTPLPGFEFEALFVPNRSGPTVIVRVESLATSMAMIAQGEGVSIQPRLAVAGLGRNDIQIVRLTTEIGVQWFAQANESGDGRAQTAIDSIAAAMRSMDGRW